MVGFPERRVGVERDRLLQLSDTFRYTPLSRKGRAELRAALDRRPPPEAGAAAGAGDRKTGRACLLKPFHLTMENF